MYHKVYDDEMNHRTYLQPLSLMLSLPSLSSYIRLPGLDPVYARVAISILWYPSKTCMTTSYFVNSCLCAEQHIMSAAAAARRQLSASQPVRCPVGGSEECGPCLSGNIAPYVRVFTNQGILRHYDLLSVMCDTLEVEHRMP